ncbi:MAG: thioredoxin family protein [Thalassotalea sp.]|nr:thioredoxin family protein [Thalassotalea sp.]MDG2393322.1 thioredoxin family protein [Thalassotalea sp.]
MKEIKVLGSGCAKCTKTAEVIEKIAQELNIAVHVIKETSPEVIMGYGVMTTPAVIVDEVNVHAGSIPHRDLIESWLLK